MRIAISGSHCSGKTTLIDEFLGAHPDYSHEPEAYTVLVEEHGEEFSAEPSADDFYRQLEFNVETLCRYPDGERVIYERCPVDYLAYMLALADLNSAAADRVLFEASMRMVLDAIRNLDLIVFLPLDDADGIEMPDSEGPQLRTAVDSRLAAILNDDELGFVSSGSVAVVEARGTTSQRLQTIENAMKSHPR